MNLFQSILDKASNVTGIGMSDPTKSSVYKFLSPYEQTAQNVTGAMQDTAKMYEQKAQGISQWGQNVANKPGYAKLGKMVKAKYPEYSDLSDEELGKKMLAKYPEYSDIVSGETSSLGYGAKAISGIGSMAVSAPGMLAGGAEQLGTGIGTIASSQSGQDVAQGVLQAGKGAVQAGFGVATGAMPIASTLFGAASGFEPVQKGFQYLGQKAGDISAGAAGLLGGNQAVQEQARGLGEIALPAVALGGLSKSGKIVKPIVNATGKGIMRGAEVVAPKFIKGAKIGADVVVSPVKSIVNTARKYVATPEEISGIQSAIKPKQRVKNGVVQRSQDAINKEITLTNSLIRNSGTKPTDLATYKTAIKGEMEKIGSEINRLTGQDLTIDITPSTGKLRQLANSDIVKTLDPADTNALLGLADRLEANGGRMSLSMAEEMNQWLNSVLKDTTVPKSEAYKRGLMTLVEDIRNGLDESISSIPGQFKDIKKAYGALRNVYGDTVSREIVFNRQNMGGLVDSIGAIEGAGNIVSGGGKILMGDVRAGVADIGRGIASNAMGRFIKSKNDPNNIIRAIFEKEGKKSIMPNIPNKPTNGNIPRNSTNSPTPVDISTVSKAQPKVTKPKESVVVPKTPIVKKETIVKPKEVNGNIRAIGQSKDFIEYFRKDLGDNVTIDGLKKFGFTESQIKDNSYNFLKSKDNPLGVSLEDLFYIAKGNTKGQTPAGPTTINTSGKKVIKKTPESPVADRSVIVRRIADEVKKKYINNGMSDEIAGLNTIKLIESMHKNPKALANMLNPNNKVTRKIFEEITGMKIGKDFTLTQLKNAEGSILETIINKYSK